MRRDTWCCAPIDNGLECTEPVDVELDPLGYVCPAGHRWTPVGGDQVRLVGTGLIR